MDNTRQQLWLPGKGPIGGDLGSKSHLGIDPALLKKGHADTLRIDIDRYPDEMDGNFFGIHFAGILIDDDTLNALRESFGKMVQNSDGTS